MFAVHVRVVDAETLKPVAVRLHVSDGLGRSCVPLGRPSFFRTGPSEDVGGQVRLGADAWYYLDGGAEMLIPAGAVRVRAWHGPEYLPLDETVEVKPGQLALRFQMHRWSNERAQGWYSGDVSALGIDPFSALLEGRAEDLDVVQIAAQQESLGPATRLAHLTAFRGAEATLSEGGHLVAVGTANRHEQLGSLLLMGCHRPVFPLACTGLTWSVLDWCDQAHRKKDGVVVLADEPCEQAGEVIAAALQGKLDALEIRSPTSPRWGLWYALLDAGCRLVLVGGSGKNSNASVLGAMRTYAHLAIGAEFTYPAWLAAVRAGRTLATAGPLLALLVGGQSPGGRATVAPGTAVSVWTEARAKVPFEALEIVHDGQVIATLEPRGEMFRGHLIHEVHPERSGWLAARCRRDDGIIAHTSPVWIDVADQPARVTSAEVLTPHLQKTRTWADSAAGEERFRSQLLGHLAAAEQRLTIG